MYSFIAETILIDASNWPKPNSTVLEIDENNGKSYLSNSASASQTYSNSLHILYQNQSGLKINMIDRNGTGVCKQFAVSENGWKIHCCCF